MNSVGVIIIGRNEGPRLSDCLRSVHAANPAVSLAAIVYVDSGSTDDSLALARSRGAHVVELDTSLPFTAARARNRGAQFLLRNHPETAYLQFLDGDTRMHPRWLAHAVEYLHHHPRIAVACGRRRERCPQATIYNLLADMEWDTPVGLATEFGGDALIRSSVFLHVGGYSEDFIAGEEPDLAARIRKIKTGPSGASHWQFARLNHDMTLHDLAMCRFSQWWRRTMRSGHALAQLAHVHGGPPLFFYRRAWRSTLFWAALLPFTIALLTAFLNSWAFLLFPLAYALLLARIARHRLHHGDDPSSAFLYALFTALGKFPQALGMARFYINLWRRRRSTLIEYKRPRPSIRPANPAPAAVGNT